MKEYTSPYDVIACGHAAVLDILTEKEQDYLRHVLDFEAMVLHVHDGVVDLVDAITGDILDTDSYLMFVRESVKYAMQNAK